MPSSSLFLSCETFVPSPPLARWAMTPPVGWPPTYPGAQSHILYHVLWLFISALLHRLVCVVCLSRIHTKASPPLSSLSTHSTMQVRLTRTHAHALALTAETRQNSRAWSSIQPLAPSPLPSGLQGASPPSSILPLFSLRLVRRRWALRAPLLLVQVADERHGDGAVLEQVPVE